MAGADKKGDSSNVVEGRRIVRQERKMDLDNAACHCTLQCDCQQPVHSD